MTNAFGAVGLASSVLETGWISEVGVLCGIHGFCSSPTRIGVLTSYFSNAPQRDPLLLLTCSSNAHLQAGLAFLGGVGCVRPYTAVSVTP